MIRRKRYYFWTCFIRTRLCSTRVEIGMPNSAVIDKSLRCMLYSSQIFLHNSAENLDDFYSAEMHVHNSAHIVFLYK